MSNEQERLARIEEQILGVRDDIGRMETSLTSATKIMSEMHVNYVPRTEIEKMVTLRDREKAIADKQFAAMWKRIERLEKWRAWLTGAVGVVVGTALLAFEYLKQWIR